MRTVVYDALEGNRNGCLLGKPTPRHPVLPRTAPRLRRALPRPDPPVVRVLDLTGNSFHGSSSSGRTASIDSFAMSIAIRRRPRRRSPTGLRRWHWSQESQHNTNNDYNFYSNGINHNIDILITQM